MYNITLPSEGIYAVGNPTTSLQAISTLVSGNILEVKTLVNGVWKSWVQGSADEFQGISYFEPGRAYIIKTSGGVTISFPEDEVIDIMEIPVINGSNLITVPYNTSTGPNNRFTADLVKKLEDQKWLSWNQGAPVDFQGFLSLESGAGYYANVISINDTVRDWLEEGIPLYIKTDPIPILNIDSSLHIVLPYRMLNVYEIYVIDYGVIYTGWEYDRSTNLLVLDVTDLEIKNEMTGRQVIVHGVTSVN